MGCLLCPRTLVELIGTGTEQRTMSKHRPEHTAPPDMFYNEEEAEKYTSNSRMIHIQSQMTERCLELLALQNQGSSTSTTASAASNSGETTPSSPQLLLDVGCGSGLSGCTSTFLHSIESQSMIFFWGLTYVKPYLQPLLKKLATTPLE